MESVVKNDESAMTFMISPKDTYIVTVIDPSFLFLSADPSSVSFQTFKVKTDNLIVYLKVNHK